NWIQVTKVENQSLFVSEKQIPSLATLGNITRNYVELRVAVRNHLLATNALEKTEARLLFETSAAEVNRLLDQYGDSMISDDKDRRLFDEYRDLVGRNMAGDRQVIALSTQGRHDEALALLATVSQISQQLSITSAQWIEHNQELSGRAGK